MSGRAASKRYFQHGGGGGLHRIGVGIAAAVIILAFGATPVRGAPRGPPHSDAAADAVVAKLREMPLPLRPFQHAITPRAVPRRLPALELRRQRVYDELHALGPASVPALARALHDPDPRMRRNAAVALDVLGGGWWHFPEAGSKLDLGPALPALIAALRDSDPHVRAWAAQDISDMGPAAASAVSRLRALLHSQDAGSRGDACNALGRMGSAAQRALPDLRRALDDSSPRVREAARDAIVSIER